jgi:hypothetical protein
MGTFRHGVPWLPVISRCLGPTHVSTHPIYRACQIHPCPEQSPLQHLDAKAHLAGGRLPVQRYRRLAATTVN